MSESKPSVRLLIGVFVGLLALTGATVGLAFLPLGRWNAAVAIAVAGAKAALVVLVFMHVRWSPRLIGVVAAGALFWLLVLVLGTLGDLLTRGPWGGLLPRG